MPTKITNSLSLYEKDNAILRELARALMGPGKSRLNRSLAYQTAIHLCADARLTKEEFRKLFQASQADRGEGRTRASLVCGEEEQKKAGAIAQALLDAGADTVDDSVVARVVLRFVKAPTKAFIAKAKDLSDGE